MRGKVWKYGDHIDTDVIIPARYLNNPDPKALASHCMVDIDEGFAGSVQPGDIMVGGWNFGCGSSREHAPVAIQASGISCVIAASFARIFYRNSINIGFPMRGSVSVDTLGRPLISFGQAISKLPNKTGAIGYYLYNLIDSSPGSGLVFRPLSPRLEMKLYLIWNKYQRFTPIADRFLRQIQSSFAGL